MKINENHKIIGERVILIPYERKHVEKYHRWMMDQDLRELTASEELTIEQEYEMQKSWRNDEDKCTFLILDKEKYELTNDEIESLIGDTNLFLQIDQDGSEKTITAETEIMIAERTAYGRRFGWEAMLLMLKYGQQYLNCLKFIAKIGFSNEKSINMFRKLQFSEISRSNVFEEITFERDVTNEWIQWLNENIKFTIDNYR